MLNNQILQLIDETSDFLDLEESVIEKDYYVTEAIHTLSNIENEYFRLIFAGGTCLAKAHKTVKRMSEDVDFKIQFKSTDKTLSKNFISKELKQFRQLISEKLETMDLKFNPPVVRNEGRYSRIEINYPTAFTNNSNLRSDILLEFTLSNIRLSIQKLPIKTLIEDTFENIILFTPLSTNCISVEETAIEKWVGLTRRVSAIDRNYHPDDATLVRHIYDLNAIKDTNKIEANFFTLAKDIVSNDARQFENQHPEYANDPRREIKQSLELLKNKSTWKERYQEFIEVMVYDNTSVQEYEHAIASLEEISEKILTNL